MWKLSKAGHLRCYEYYHEYDDSGVPIVNKEDIDTLLFLDTLESKGIAHENKKNNKTGEK